MGKKIAVVAAIVLASIATIACGKEYTTTPGGTGTGQPVTSAAPQGPTTVNIGQPLVLHIDNVSAKLDVTITVGPGKTYTKEPGDFGMKPEKGVFIVFNVNGQVAAGGSGSYHMNPFTFSYVAADGTVYEGAFATFPDDLDAVDLAAGQKEERDDRFRYRQRSRQGWQGST